jgi:endonuclease YncB( thermonuclease family)
MKRSRLMITLLLALILSSAAAAQTRMAGKVIDVVDGRTVVIDTDGRKVTAEIQYIEVPEPEQPLHAVVRDHLVKLALGKTVEFHPHGFRPGKAFGQIFVGSTDLAVQMLRDGAAWHVSPEKSGQKASDSNTYEFQQTQAKLESRGVWGVKDLKPAWQFRADKLEQQKQERLAAEQAAARASETQFAPASAKKPVRRSGPWSDVNPSMKDPGPLLHGYNAATKTGWLSTSLMGIKELENAPAGQKLACDVTYMYKQESEKSRKGSFTFTLVSVADEWRFLKANTVSVIVDEKNVFAGKPKRTTTKEDGKSVEKLTYEVSKEAIQKIVYGGEVVIKIGDYAVFPGQGMQLLLYNMLEAAN